MTTSATSNSLSTLDPSLTQGVAKKAPTKEIGKDEFLQLLVTQLKNQDPMDPMKDEQFAVNLAQFSQVEQLVSINEKLGSQSSNDVGSLAAYLGHQVILSGDSVDLKGGKSAPLHADLDQDISRVQVKLFDSNDKLVTVKDIGDLKKGSQSIDLSGVDARDGFYKYQVVGADSNGQPVKIAANKAGVVTGFIPGADPKLLIDSTEISPNDVVKVTSAPSQS